MLSLLQPSHCSLCSVLVAATARRSLRYPSTSTSRSALHLLRALTTDSFTTTAASDTRSALTVCAAAQTLSLSRRLASVSAPRELTARMHLCLQSSLLTPVAEDSLLSYYRRLSSLAARPASSSPLSSSFPPLPLQAGDVLEVHGGSATGKSAVLLSCVLSCALPAAVSGLALHGCDRSCVLVDCDGRVSVYRLQCMLEERCSKAWQQHWEAVAAGSASQSAGDELRAAASRSRRQAVSLLTQLVLRRLRVVQAADEVELMAALLTVDRICEAEQGGLSTHPASDEQQWQQQMHNIAPYLRDRQRPSFHSRDESEQQPNDSSLSHGRSIARLPLPQPPLQPLSEPHNTSACWTSPAVSLISRYSPLSPTHSLSVASPEPLSQAKQPAPRSASFASPTTAADGSSLVRLSPASVPSVSEVLSALSSLCVCCPPPVELVLIDNVAAFYFAARTADRLSSASASSPANSSSTAPSVYSSVSGRLKRLLLDRQLAAVVSKPPLFAANASAVQSEWKHSEYLPAEYSSMVRWRLLLRMKAEGGSLLDDEGEPASSPSAALARVDDDDSGGLRECRLLRCRDEEDGGGGGGGPRQAKNTVSFHSTLAHAKEGIVFV